MNIEPVNYSIIREDYGIYKCEKGITLHARTIISAILKETKDGNSTYHVELKDMSTTYLTDTIDMSKYQHADPNSIVEDDIVSTLSFEEIKKPINIYEIKENMIFFVPMVHEIRLTNKKNKSGIPIIKFSTKNNLNLIDKKSLINE